LYPKCARQPQGGSALRYER